MEENKENLTEEKETASPETEEAAEEVSPLDEAQKLADEFKDKFLRVSAEYENFRKRTQKEKESLYADGKAACAQSFLPLADNMDRALEAAKAEDAENPIVKGMEMIFRQFEDILKSLSIEAIPAVGEQFDPEFHNAVMHIEDEETDANTIVEEFQKGYKMGDKVLRHSMVKVAN